MVLCLALGNYFDTSIGSLICFLVDVALVTIVGRIMGPFLGNYLGSNLEEFILLSSYFYLVQL